MKLCGHEVGLHQPIFLIAGPCVIESEQLHLVLTLIWSFSEM